MSSPKPIVIFYAPNVYIGGGKLLLIRAIKELSIRSTLVAILNSHLKIEVESLALEGIKIHWIDGSLLNYVAAEMLLNKISNINSRILCFHGLPPILCKSKNIFIYAQNKLLFESQNLLKTPYRLATIIYIQKIIFILFSKRVKVIFVQTKTMKSAVQNYLKKGLTPLKSKNLPKVLLAPFISFSPADRLQSSEKVKKYDFIYPSTVQPHKNHAKLIEAWKMLASDNIFPSLAIPLTRPDNNLDYLVSRTNEECGTKICIINGLGHEECLLAIQSSTALVYPSLCESFGLPLIEGSVLKLPIVASDLDYVFDVCTPIAIFNPNSSRSICEAIKKFINEGSSTPPPQPNQQLDKLDLLCDELLLLPL